MRHFIARGLTRFVVEPIDLMALGRERPGGDASPPCPTTVRSPSGAARCMSSSPTASTSWLVALGPGATADLLAEMVAALAYHYDPDAAGGTAITDVCVNDGDFAARRRRDGTFDVRLTAARRREAGIGPSLLLLYLIQMMAYEDWSVDGNLVGLPTLVSNPSVAFAGVVRGLRYRCRDLGRPEERGRARGAALDPRLRPLARGARLPPVGRAVPRRPPAARRSAAIRASAGGASSPADEARRPRAARPPGSGGRATAASARALRSLPRSAVARDRPRPRRTIPGAARINDLGRDDLLRLLDEAQRRRRHRATASPTSCSRAGPTGASTTWWPRCRARAACAGSRAASPSAASSPTPIRGRWPASVPHPPAAGAPRPIANPEMFGGPSLPAALHAAAVRTFPTFEAYMDARPPRPALGLLRRTTCRSAAAATSSPTRNRSRPRYGAWIAALAFRFWRDMVARGELAETDPFPIVEFGAGNGRLARDILDAAPRRRQPRADATTRGGRSRRASRTASTRRPRRCATSSRRCSGGDAVVAEGDARRPGDDAGARFPRRREGPRADERGPRRVRRAQGGAGARRGRRASALVVPRVEAALQRAVGDALARRIADADASVRRTFGFRAQRRRLLPGRRDLGGGDGGRAPPARPRSARRLLGALWFEEAYVPAAAVPELAAHLAANADAVRDGARRRGFRRRGST